MEVKAPCVEADLRILKYWKWKQEVKRYARKRKQKSPMVSSPYRHQLFFTNKRVHPLVGQSLTFLFELEKWKMFQGTDLKTLLTIWLVRKISDSHAEPVLLTPTRPIWIKNTMKRETLWQSMPQFYHVMQVSFALLYRSLQSMFFPKLLDTLLWYYFLHFPIRTNFR